MKNNIILYHPRTSHEKNYLFFWAPYSLLSIAAPLVEQGYDVEIIDGNLDQDNKDIDFNEAICVGISSMIGHQIEDAIQFVSRVRETDTPIVWGGPLPTILPKTTLDSDYVDYIVRGIGDLLFPKMVQALKEKKALPRGVGTEINQIGEIQTLQSREIFPKYPFHLLNLEDYVRHDPTVSKRVINYISSQGCPFECGFCSDVAMYKSKWDAYSAERTLNEIMDIANIANVDGIKFYDSNFFANSKRALSFAEGLLKYNKNISWAASAHPNNLLSYDYTKLNTFRQSGLKRLLIGAESGVQEELDLVKKHMVVGDVVEVADRLDRAGIIGSFTFVTGYPTMPSENIDKTLAFAENLSDNYSNHEFKVHLYLPFPGTALYDLAMRHGFIPPNTLDGWGKLDYYDITTPWIDDEYQNKIRDFNKRKCPYVL